MKTNKIITAEGSDGTSYKIEDGKIKAPGNKGDVKVDVKKDDKKAKAEVTTQEAKKNDGKKTDKSTAAVTTESPKTTESAKKENAEKTEKKTEQKAEEKKPEAKKEEKKQEPTTEKKPEISTHAPACSHNWVWHTHTETVHKSEKYLVSDAWDEPVYENHSFCNACGCDLTANFGGATTDGASDHLAGCGTGYHSGNVQVGTVHHEAVYDTDEWDETVEVNDYQYCSKCGEKK